MPHTHPRPLFHARDGLVRTATLALGAVLLLTLLVPLGCQSHRKPWNADPDRLASPYATEREVVWAVVPIRNESGVAVADELRLTDALVATIEEIRGVSALPLNRTLAAMRAAGIAEVDSAAQATALARRMNADAVVVASLTAWDPYEPPKLGINLALFARSDSMGVIDTTGLDPRRLAMASTDRDPWDFRHDPSEPLSVVTLHLDANNGAIRAAVKAYADGRADPNSATGWQGYFTTMHRFERFACFYATHRLLRQEHDRLVAQADALEQRRRDADAERAKHLEHMDAVGSHRALMGIDNP